MYTAAKVISKFFIISIENTATKSTHMFFIPSDNAANNTVPIEITNNENERLRRQQLLRFGLIVCLLFILLDKDTSNSNNLRSSTATATTYQYTYNDKVRLKDEYNEKLNLILNAASATNPDIQSGESNSPSPHLNITSFYRGLWRNPIHDLSHDQSSLLLGARRDNLTYLSPGTGSTHMQLVAVPVSHVPDLNFVYGVLKLYDGETELSYPMQGVYINSQRKVSLFSTPYTTQRLQMEIHTSRVSGAVVTISNSTDDSIILQHRRLSDTGDAENSSLMQNPSTAFSSLLEGTRTLLNTSWLEPSVLEKIDDYISALKNSIISCMGSAKNNDLTTSNVKVDSSRFEFDWSQLKLDNLLQAHYDPSVHATEQMTGPIGRRRLTIDGDTSLSPTAILGPGKTAAGGLKDQLDDASQLTIVDSETELTHPTEYGQLKIVLIDTRDSMSRNSTIDHLSDNKLVFDFGYNLLSPKFQRFQKDTKASSSAQPMNCPYAFHLSVSPPNVDGTAKNAQLGNILNERLVQQMDIRSKLIEGSFKSDSCKKDIEVFISAYATPWDIQAKVENYSYWVTAIGLMQIVLMVYQLRICSAPALAGRMSIVGVFGQSLLDAILCMVHLLLGTIMPSIFFASFIWISFIKLLLFSVFNMRLIVSICQARFSQESWSNLRKRLVQLHINFYATTFVVMLLVYSFPSWPVLAVFLMYSFWVPQIFYSAYSGTKHPFDPLYLMAVTSLRLFIPLYLLGCPNNIVSTLTPYFKPMHEIFIPGSSKESRLLFSYHACFVLIVWVALQLTMLILQGKYGARFFIPRKLLPSKYDYRRSIPLHLRVSRGGGVVSPSSMDLTEVYAREGDVETGLLEDQQGFECIICYNAIHINNRDYSITPCDHVFHSHCLSQWTDVKLECPICRQVLPSLED